MPLQVETSEAPELPVQVEKVAQVQAAAEEKKGWVKIEGVDGFVYEAEITPTLLVKTLKAEIQQVVGMEVSEQKLLFKCKEMKDNRQVKSYSIGEGQTIKLVHVPPNQPAPQDFGGGDFSRLFQEFLAHQESIGEPVQTTEMRVQSDQPFPTTPPGIIPTLIGFRPEHRTQDLLRMRNACGACGTAITSALPSPKKTMRCGRCKRQKYCSRECQSAGWGKHKKTCVPYDTYMQTGLGKVTDFFHSLSISAILKYNEDDVMLTPPADFIDKGVLNTFIGGKPDNVSATIVAKIEHGERPKRGGSVVDSSSDAVLLTPFQLAQPAFRAPTLTLRVVGKDLMNMACYCHEMVVKQELHAMARAEQGSALRRMQQARAYTVEQTFQAKDGRNYLSVAEMLDAMSEFHTALLQKCLDVHGWISGDDVNFYQFLDDKDNNALVPRYY